MYFRFFACKNYNAGIIVPATITFLFNIFLTIFVFSIADMKVAAINVLN